MKQSAMFSLRSLARFLLVLSVGVLAAASATVSHAAAEPVRKEVYDSIMEAQALVDAGDFEGALTVLEPLSLRTGLSGYEKANVLNYIGFVHYNMGDIPTTIRVYEDMLAIPQLDNALGKQTTYTLAQLYTTQEHYDIALTKLREWRWMETDPSPESFVLGAQILFNLERYADMVPDLRAAINLSERQGQPTKEDWWKLLQVAQEKLGRYADLADTHEQMIRRWPTEKNFDHALVGFFKAGDARRFVDGAQQLLNSFPDTKAIPAIHVAAARGDLESIQRLVATGSSVEFESSLGLTPLTIAARFGQGSVVDLLLELGARVDGSADPASTPIIHAAAGGHSAVVRQLWQAGADTALYTDSDIKLLPYIARAGDADLIRELVAAQPTLLESSGPHALSEAAMHARVEALDALLELGVSPVETESHSTLGAALMGGDIDILAKLAAPGADLDAPVRDWPSPLHLAVHYGHAGAVRWLLDQDVDVDKTADDGVSALARAIIDRQTNIVAILVEAGANLGDSGVRDYDALMLAAQVRSAEIAAILIKAGAEPQGKLAKLARWKPRDVRRFLKRHSFERIQTTGAETWSAPRTQGPAAQVVLPSGSRSLSLPELIRIVRDSRLTMDTWLAAV